MTTAAGIRSRGPGPSVVAFTVLAFGVSWSAWGVAMASEAPVADVAVVVGSFGPSVAVLALLARSGGVSAVRRALGRLVRIRGALAATAAAVMLPVVVAVAAVLVDRALGGRTPLELPPWWAVPIVAGYVLVLGGPLGEELGWRGHLLPVLESRLGPVVATLVVAGVWFVWHLPLFLVPGTVQSSIPLWLFAAQILTTSVVYTWFVHLAPRSLVPALAFHTSFNVTVGLVLLQPTEAPATRPLLLALTVVAVLAGVLACTPTFRSTRDLPAPTQAGAHVGSPVPAASGPGRPDGGRASGR